MHIAKKIVAAVTTAATAFTMITAVPWAGADTGNEEIITKKLSIPLTCGYSMHSSGNKTKDSQFMSIPVTVSYPRFVTPGEKFVATIDPEPMTAKAPISRISYDIKLPNNIDKGSAKSSLENGRNLSNPYPAIIAKPTIESYFITNVDTLIWPSDASLIRVASKSLATQLVATDPFASNYGPAGMSVDSAGSFKLPKLTVSMTAASNSNPGDKVQLSFRNTGGGSNDGQGYSFSYIEILRKNHDLFFNYANDIVKCHAEPVDDPDLDGHLTNTIIVKEHVPTAVTFTEPTEPTFTTESGTDNKLTVPITVKVTKKNTGEPIDQGKVKFIIDGTETSPKPVAPGGTASTTVDFDRVEYGHPSVQHTIKAIYLADDNTGIRTSFETTTVTIQPATTRIGAVTIAENSVEATAGKADDTTYPVTLTARVEASVDGAVLHKAGIPVTFSITNNSSSSKLTKTATTTEGAEGQTVSTSLNLEPGTYTIKAEVADYSTTGLELTAKNQKPSIILDLKDIINDGQTEVSLQKLSDNQVTATVTTRKGAADPVAASGRPLTVRIDGVAQPDQYTTDENGQTTIPITLNSPGPHTITVASEAFKEDSWSFPGVESNSVILTGPDATKPVPPTIRLTTGKDSSGAAKLTATVTAGASATSIDDGTTVSFYVNNSDGSKTLLADVPIDKNGTATLVPTLALGEYKVSAVVNAHGHTASAETDEETSLNIPLPVFVVPATRSHNTVLPQDNQTGKTGSSTGQKVGLGIGILLLILIVIAVPLMPMLLHRM